MKRPRIGITTDTRNEGGAYYQLAWDYATSVEKAGGLPLAIPYKTDPSLIPDYVDLFDGILFTGGDDLDPSLYGEEWHPKAARIDPDRQNFELALIAEVEKRRLPMMAICLGCQLLNIYRGGSLTQFIPDLPGKREHRKVGPELLRHAVHVEPNSQVGQAIGKTEISANTYHKQAINRVGRGLRVIATAPDGIIEGLEDSSFPLLAAVQWHPEKLHDEQEHLAPFRLLVEKARLAKSM
jgi:putative glutamine amidotransferase